MINIQLTITGRVQGVGFRWGTLQIARQLGLYGFVRNQADGTVYVEAQGPKVSTALSATLLKAPPPTPLSTASSKRLGTSLTTGANSPSGADL